MTTPGAELPDFAISDAGPLSRAARSHGHRRFAEVAEAVRALPYGRVRNAHDAAAVLDEGKGTCSSKHRFLSALAHECGHPDIELPLGLYEMSDVNTPGVGNVLRAERLSSIPEAHCYLTYRGQRLDFTGLATASASPFDTLIGERTVSPAELPSTKIAYHRAAIAVFARARGLDTDRVWAIRERCIAWLAEHPSNPT